MILSQFKSLFARKHALLIAVCALVQFSCTNQPNRALSIDDKYSLAVEAVKHLDKKDIKEAKIIKREDEFVVSLPKYSNSLIFLYLRVSSSAKPLRHTYNSTAMTQIWQL